MLNKNSSKRYYILAQTNANRFRHSQVNTESWIGQTRESSCHCAEFEPNVPDEESLGTATILLKNPGHGIEGAHLGIKD